LKKFIAPKVLGIKNEALAQTRQMTIYLRHKYPSLRAVLYIPDKDNCSNSHTNQSKRGLNRKMKQKTIYILLLGVLIIVSGCASYGPKNNGLSLILSQTQQALLDLEKKITTTNEPKLKKAYFDVKQKSEALFPVLEKCNDKYALNKEYLSTLEASKKTLITLSKSYDTTPDKTYILEAITTDYDAKLQTINNTAKNDATTKIKVIVNSNEEEGFFVFGKLSYEQGQNIKRFRFNQPTQNAIQDFVPGYYLFWLEKEDRVGEPELHLIMSNSGEEEKTLILQTPK